MCIHKRRRVFGLVLLSAALAGSASAADLEHLLTYMPSDSNVLLIVNAEKVFNSKLGKEIGWKQEYETSYAASPLLIPPDAQLFVMAARMDFEFLKPQWEVAVAALSDPPTLQEVEQRTRGASDDIAGYKAVETLRDSYVVQFGSDVYGIRKPADRQIVSRWLQDIRNRKSVGLSDYLGEQAVYPAKVGTEIIFAFDLHDVISATAAEQALVGSQVLKGSQVSPKQAAGILASIRGVTLGVRVTDRIYGKIKIDCGVDTSSLAGIAHPLLLEIVGEAGAMLDEFPEWKGGASGNQITWEGELTRPGLRRIFSFLELDARAVDAPDTESQTEEPDVTTISKHYFDSIQQYLHDLKHDEKGAVNFAQIGLWFDKYANKIEKMPTLNVDNDLVDYGMWVTQKLRDATGSIQGVGIRTGARTAQVTPSVYGTTAYGGYGPYNRYGTYGYGWRPYGGGYAAAKWEIRDVEAQRNAIRAEERATGATQARQIVAEIQSETLKMRRQMTERYSVQF